MRTPRVQVLTGLLLASSLLLSGCADGLGTTTGPHSSLGSGSDAIGATGGSAPASTDSAGTAAKSPAGTKSGRSSGRHSSGPGPETATPEVALHTLKPVPVGATASASLDSGVQVSVTGVQDVTVKASGPGEVAGKAVAATVRVRNTSKAAIDLGGFVVTASVAGDVPASPSDADPAAPMSGKLAPGATADGVYVFTVPGSDVTGLEIQVSSDTAADIAVFRR